MGSFERFYSLHDKVIELPEGFESRIHCFQFNFHIHLGQPGQTNLSWGNLYLVLVPVRRFDTSDPDITILLEPVKRKLTFRIIIIPCKGFRNDIVFTCWLIVGWIQVAI